MKKIILITTLLTFAAFGFALSPQDVFATDCFTTLTANQEVAGNCTLATYVDGSNASRLVSGVDSGSGSTNTATLTVSSGTMTINGNETLVFGSLNLTGGSIALANGAAMEVGKSIWMIDSDNDGSPSEAKLYVAAVAPSNGRRLNAMTYVASVDCNDNNGSITAGSTSTFYQDSDGDTYGNPSVTQAACSAPSGYVANNTDCYDSNANANPGSSTCSTAHRGDGSFDYNCDGSSARCSTLLGSGSSCSAAACLSYCSGGSSCACAYPTTCSVTGTATCGTSGHYCATTANYQNGCVQIDDHNCSDNTSLYCTSTATATQNCQ